MAPIHDACKKGDVEEVKRLIRNLIRNGADIHAKESIDGNTPLHCACAGYLDSIETVQVLLKYGADKDINVKNKYGDTPLNLATSLNHQSQSLLFFGRTKIVEVLLENGADMNVKGKNGNTPLHDAAGNDWTEIVKLLLKNGADMNVKGRNGNTPLHDAARKGRTETVKVLLKYGADKDINVKNKYGDTPLNLATSFNREILSLFNLLVFLRIETVKVLLENGADMNVKGENGNTPLHNAAGNDCTEIVKVLLKNGADMNVKGRNGNTPLHDAAREGHTETVKVLLKNGADKSINVKNKYGDTPLHKAAGSGSAKTVKLLLDNGADKDINVKDSNGDTPFHFVAKNKKGQTETFKLLIDNSADIPFVQMQLANTIPALILILESISDVLLTGVSYEESKSEIQLVALTFAILSIFTNLFIVIGTHFFRKFNPFFGNYGIPGFVLVVLLIVTEISDSLYIIGTPDDEFVDSDSNTSGKVLVLLAAFFPIIFPFLEGIFGLCLKGDMGSNLILLQAVSSNIMIPFHAIVQYYITTSENSTFISQGYKNDTVDDVVGSDFKYGAALVIALIVFFVFMVLMTLFLSHVITSRAYDDDEKRKWWVFCSHIPFSICVLGCEEDDESKSFSKIILLVNSIVGLPVGIVLSFIVVIQLQSIPSIIFVSMLLLRLFFLLVYFCFQPSLKLKGTSKLKEKNRKLEARIKQLQEQLHESTL